ncbi:hypothetical protein DFJ74DRAFT_684811 [Hyaloraphidium curvatum]|nr:hypothetical protein DFJ74DRAFT_684811 [Hyaloraphidium curvatum]
MATSIDAEAAALGLRWAPLETVSLAAPPAEAAAALLRACTTAGFFYLVDHGVPAEEVKELYGLAQKVHEEVPLEEHVRYKSSAAVDGNYAGYVGSDTSDSGVAAYYNMAKPGTGLEKPLPAVLERRAELLTRFQQRCLEVNDRVLRLLSLALQLPEDYLSRMHAGVSGSHLRLMWYPAREEARDAELGNVRVSGHTDYGSITMMFSPEVVALQVLDNADGETWRFVKPLPGALVCNIGDTLQFVTGSVVKSTQHRVVRPPLPSQSSRPRYNVLYFLRADDACPLHPVPSPLVPASAREAEGVGMKAGEWVAARVKATVRMRGYGGKVDGGDKAAEEYNRLQRVVNKGQGREALPDSYPAVGPGSRL